MSRRIPASSTDRKITFNGGYTGLTGFTVKYSKDGGTWTTYASPAVSELGDGKYAVTINEGTSLSTSNDEIDYFLQVSATGMMTVDIALEVYRPKITVGNTLGVSALGFVEQCVANSDMRGTDGANTTAPPSVSSIAGSVWGYDLSGAFLTNTAAAILKSILVDTETTIPGLVSGLHNLSAADFWQLDLAAIILSGTQAGQILLDVLEGVEGQVRNMRFGKRIWGHEDSRVLQQGR